MKGWLGLIIGLAGGFATGFAVSHVIERKKFEERIDKELDAMKKAQNRRDHIISEPVPEPIVVRKTDRPMPTKTSLNDPDLKVVTIRDEKDLKDDNDKVSYYKMVKDTYLKSKADKEMEGEVEENSDDSDDESVINIETAEEKLAKIIEANPFHDKPFMITWSAFNDPDDIHYRSDYEHITLDYFLGDNVVAYSDEPHTPLAKEDHVLGNIWRTAFGNYDDYGYDDDMCVYVRNDAMRTDYEIIKDKISYMEYISGVSGKGGADDEH